MRIQIMPLPHVVLGEAVTQPFALIIDQAPIPSVVDAATAEIVRLHLDGWDGFRERCGASAHLITAETVEVVGRYAAPAKAELIKAEPAVHCFGSGQISWSPDAMPGTTVTNSGQDVGEPAEIAGLPPEVRTLIHAVDRMRDDWAEADVHVRYELWMAVHDASDAVYRAYRESPPTAHLTAGWPRLQRDRSEDDL